VVAVAHVDLDLAATQAGRDLDLRQRYALLLLDLAQALGDLGLRSAEHAQRVGPQWRRSRQHRRNRGGLECRRPHRLQLSRRAGQDDHHALAGRNDQAWSRADRIERD
jgi:hypothetical protein